MVYLELERAARKASKCLGSEILIVNEIGTRKPGIAQFFDDSTGSVFTLKLGPPSQYKKQIKQLHEMVYRARSREAFRRQGGVCLLCSSKMSGWSNTETDHINSRGAHGRDDRMENLRVVHSECHRQRHGAGKK